MKIIVAALMINCAAVSITAAAGPYFKGPVEFAGTGCPAGSISVAGETSATLTVMFDKYDAGNGMPSQSGHSRTGCSFALPVHVPTGFQLSKVTADWMGYTKGSTKLKRKYFFAQNPNKTMTSKVTTFPPPNGGEFTVHDSVTPYTTCGPARDLTFRINSSVEAVSNPSYIYASPVDKDNKLAFKLTWVQCP